MTTTTALGQPSATYLIDSYRFSWPDIEFLCDRLHEERDGLKCELSVSTSRKPMAGLLRSGRFNLSSATTRSQWQRALEERLPDTDWYAAFEMVCALTTRRWRDGEPVLDLAEVEPYSGVPFLLSPFIVEGAASVLFAEGGTGKSLLALAMCVMIATGDEVIPGVHATRYGPTLYLDWEWDAAVHAERLKAICEGAGIEVPHGVVHYRHEMASIYEAAPTIRRRIAELGVAFVVVDSLGFARGGEPESADLTLKTFSALRTFGVPVLCLDHVAKNATDKKHSFGSVYTTNAARITWRADAIKEEGANKIIVGLTNQKSNGRFQKARGYEITMDIDENDKLTSVRFEATDLRDIPGLTKALPMRDQIAGILKAARKALDVESITQSLVNEGSRWSSDSIRVCLNRNKGMFEREGEGGWKIRDYTLQGA